VIPGNQLSGTPETRREVIREAIHRTICDQRASHDASLGRCSVAADAVAMDLAVPQPRLDTHAPGDFHRYRVICEVCGVPGYLRVSWDPERAPAEPTE